LSRFDTYQHVTDGPAVYGTDRQTDMPTTSMRCSEYSCHCAMWCAV